MRKALLALLGFLAVGAGAALAQPVPADPPPPTPGPMSPEHDAGQYGQPWDRSWESIIMSAAPTHPPAPPPAHQESEQLASPSHVWFGADYLLWWTKQSPFPAPLLTTGPATAAIPGGLTQPGTQVLFGGTSVDYGMANGARANFGFWCDTDRHWGVDATGFFLEKLSRGINIHSNANGSPVLAQPLIDPATGQEFTEVISLPGLLSGGAAMTTQSHLSGWDINGLANVVRSEHLNLDLLAGFRMAMLDEDLQAYTEFAPLSNNFLTFQGQPVSTTSLLLTNDHFRIYNRFYGVQMGGRAEWTIDHLAIEAVAKVALGDTQELVRIDGQSALINANGTGLAVPGGILAVSSNIGRHYQSPFAALPEGDFQLRYWVAPHVEVRCGYSILYLTNVLRASNQVSRNIPPGLIPTDPAFGTATGTPPAFQFRTSDYWAQGLNFGLAFWF
jgi:hypothetical protein